MNSNFLFYFSKVTRGKIYMFLATKKEVESYENDQEQHQITSRQLFMNIILAFKPVQETIQQYINEHNVVFSGLSKPLPSNVHLLTLENWDDVRLGQILVRLENSAQQSTKTTKNIAQVSTADIFTTNNIQKIESIQQGNLVVGHLQPLTSTSQSLSIEPQEIVTLVYQVKRNLSHSACGFSWEKRKPGNELPNNAVLAGNEADGRTPLYVCRQEKGGELIPGKYNSGIHCHLSYAGAELEYNDPDVEILVTNPNENANYQWVPRHGGDPFPDRAFVAGTKSNPPGQPIYIGRCHTNKLGLIVGKIDEYFYYPYSGSEHKIEDCLDHEILAC